MIIFFKMQIVEKIVICMFVSVVVAIVIGF
jgi:hypothetical protein